MDASTKPANMHTCRPMSRGQMLLQLALKKPARAQLKPPADQQLPIMHADAEAPLEAVVVCTQPGARTNRSTQKFPVMDVEEVVGLPTEAAVVCTQPDAKTNRSTQKFPEMDVEEVVGLPTEAAVVCTQQDSSDESDDYLETRMPRFCSRTALLRRSIPIKIMLENDPDDSNSSSSSSEDNGSSDVSYSAITSDESVDLDDIPMLSTKKRPRKRVSRLPASALQQVPLAPLPLVDNQQIPPAESQADQQVTQVSKENVVEIEDMGSVPRRRAKSGQSDPDVWFRNRNKKLRMEGKAYKAYKSGEKSYITKEPRYMGDACDSNTCAKSRSCRKFTEVHRQDIFTKFWKMDWDQRKVYVATLIDNEPPKQATVQVGQSRRKNSLKYHLKLGEVREHVCKDMFLSTLGIGEWSARKWALESQSGMHDTFISQVQEKKRNTENTEGRETAREFLRGLTKVESHYCRASSSKIYLEPNIGSQTALHDIFVDHCATIHKRAVSRQVLVDEFKKMNLGLFTPRKDQCNICSAHKVNNVSEEEYLSHLEKKEEAKNEKQSDKLEAETSKKFVLTLDLQAVLLSPRIQAGAQYYKTKLACHNYTIHRMDNHDAINYFWHEGEGALLADNFASCLQDYIKNEVPESTKEITIYSDGCTYQNRNSVLSNMLAHMAVTKDIKIIQKYLEPGHTQMECDSVHSTIERKLGKKSIYCPAAYVEVIRNARRSQPYRVKYINHTFFKDFSQLKYYTSIRPGCRSGDPVVTDLRQLIYLPDGSIKYKLSHKGEELLLPRSARVSGPREITKLYESALKIPKSKFKHLQELKRYIPLDFHPFYDSLPHDD